MDNDEKILFETKPPSYRVNLKRILTLGFILNLTFIIVFRIPLDVVIEFFILLFLLDLFTFYLPSVSKKYIVTRTGITRQGWFGAKKASFDQIGSVTAARGRILVVSTKGKVIFKIHEVFLHNSVREGFKDVIFKYMK